MEGEIYNFVMVWAIVLASLCYSHTIAKFIPKGKTRLLAILPISCLFIFLPLNLTSINLGTVSCFFIAWLANFKLLLLAFGTGPLFSDPPIPLTRFIPLACLPIKIQQPNQESKQYPSQKSKDNPFQESKEHPFQDSKKYPSPKKSKDYPLQESQKYPSQKVPKKGHKSLFNYVIKILLFATLIKIYDFKENLHPYFLLLLYCFHIYFVLELLLATFAAFARALVCAELEPQFDDPYLATSLQDFWGKRWNLMVSNILRPTVFDPIKCISSRLIGKKWAPLPAVFVTFLASGLMHELIFYNFGRQKTNWQVLCFFLLHGVALSVEIGVKKMLDGKFRLPPAMSRPLTLTFVVFTSFWLFFPPFLRGNAEMKACTETLAFIEFVKHGRLISPNELSCPLL